MKTSDLTTPTLILDQFRLTRNIAAMTARVRELGVDLRPHLKTAKSADIARLAVNGSAGGITVATLREAEYFLENAFTDMTYAVPICPTKLDQAVALMDWRNWAGPCECSRSPRYLTWCTHSRYAISGE